MLTIALDEQGDFENLENKLRSAPVFIGGIIYDDLGSKDDLKNETERLKLYLKNVCKNVGRRYPQDLHYSNDGTNGNGVRLAKEEFGRTIEEFMVKGTFKEKELLDVKREGRYYIFASLRGEHGKEALLKSDVSEALKEDFASNLYVHMAEDVVSRIIFHNPIIDDINKVKLELATRRVLLTGEDRNKKVGEYMKLGFNEVQRPKDERKSKVSEIKLTNPDNYRTAIEREMLNYNVHKVAIDRIGVKSIYYQHEAKGMDFLYLADSICSYLSFNVKGCRPHEWIESFEKSCKQINGNVKNLIWGYDEADDYFSKAWKYFEEKDYYRALSVAYEGKVCRSKLTKFYIDNWFKVLCDKISQQSDISSFSMAVKKFKESVLNNNLNQDKLIFIFEILKKQAKNVVFTSKKEEAELYQLYDAGMTSNIHIGNLDEANKCYEKVKEYAEYVATETYLRTRNKMVVFLCDNLEFENALKLADENVHYHELLTEMKKEMFGEVFTESLNHAIAISQRAQVYAFMMDEKAEEDFLVALEIMDKGTPDYYITLSYLLHYYISMGMKEKYENYSIEYFGGITLLEEQFNYLIIEGAKEKNARFSLKFALYVYIKALYTFYIDDINEKLLNKLKNIEETMNELDEFAYKQMNGHPWELIYKYLALVMRERGWEHIADWYISIVAEWKNKYNGVIGGIVSRCCECGNKKSNNSVDKDKYYTYMYD